MISFIIPTKNEESVLEKTLRCLVRYSGPHEIIVSDGKSTDGTVAIAKKYADKALEYKGEAKQGIAAGRNAGAAAAEGDLLLFLDADMYIDEPDEFFKVAIDCFGKDPKLVGLTVNLRVFPEMATWADRFIFSALSAQYLIENNFLGIGAASGEFQMIKKDAFRQVGGYNEYLAAAEDHDLFRRLTKIGRTRFEKTLTAYHTGRRAHAIGWPKLLFTWAVNGLSVLLFKKSVSREWKEVR